MENGQNYQISGERYEKKLVKIAELKLENERLVEENRALQIQNDLFRNKLNQLLE